jgi:hypothetical protein
MPGRVGAAVILVALGLVAIAIGYLMSGACGGGYSLFLFGVGALLIGGAVALMGGTLVLPFVGIAAVILIVYGLELLSNAGCAI